MSATRSVGGNFTLIATSTVFFKIVSEDGFRLFNAVTTMLGRKLRKFLALFKVATLLIVIVSWTQSKRQKVTAILVFIGVEDA